MVCDVLCESCLLSRGNQRSAHISSERRLSLLDLKVGWRDTRHGADRGKGMFNLDVNV